jgi:nucleotide-binding universal stress UspA family protein
MSFIAAALKPRSVLIATDFSEASNTALRHALAIARFYESKFCFAHVVSSLGLTLAGPSAIAACEEAASREAAELKESLIRTGALAGIQHKFIVRRGELWPELREIIHQEDIDLIVIGTHGRHGISKLFFGSVAEQIFLQANCPVLIFGPNSQARPWVGASSGPRIFLFATDLGPVSDHILPHAVAVANHFGAKLEFLSVIPAVPPTQRRGIDGGLPRLEDDTRLTALRAMSELANRTALDLRPEFHVEFESKKQVSESIVETAERLRADLIIMGQGCSTYTGLKARLGSALVYDVACQASSPVLIVSCPSEQANIRSRVTEMTNSPLSEADLIRIHALGVQW